MDPQLEKQMCNQQLVRSADPDCKPFSPLIAHNEPILDTAENFDPYNVHFKDPRESRNPRENPRGLEIRRVREPITARHIRELLEAPDLNIAFM